MARLAGQLFVLTAAHVLRDSAERPIEIASSSRGGPALDLELLGVATTTAPGLDAAVLMVRSKDIDDALDDIALPGSRVWPLQQGHPDLSGGYLTTSGFPGVGYQQSGSVLRLSGIAATSVRAGCADSPACPLDPTPWSLDVWVAPDGYANPDNILQSETVPWLKGVSGGPVWWNSDRAIEPRLIALHRQTISGSESSDPETIMSGDRFARAELVAVHLRLAANLFPSIGALLQQHHQWILDIGTEQTH